PALQGGCSLTNETPKSSGPRLSLSPLARRPVVEARAHNSNLGAMQCNARICTRLHAGGMSAIADPPHKRAARDIYAFAVTSFPKKRARVDWKEGRRRRRKIKLQRLSMDWKEGVEIERFLDGMDGMGRDGWMEVWILCV
ncbi:MAG: hypothetical protein Q9173_005579, partial [Seirophora scorigena]